MVSGLRWRRPKVCKVCSNGPAGARDKGKDAEIQQDVQFEKYREAFFRTSAEIVLYCSRGSPRIFSVFQTLKRCHDGFIGLERMCSWIAAW
jgi:hypothetical protein